MKPSIQFQQLLDELTACHLRELQSIGAQSRGPVSEDDLQPDSPLDVVPPPGPPTPHAPAVPAKDASGIASFARMQQRAEEEEKVCSLAVLPGIPQLPSQSSLQPSSQPPEIDQLEQLDQPEVEKSRQRTSVRNRQANMGQDGSWCFPLRGIWENKSDQEFQIEDLTTKKDLNRDLAADSRPEDEDELVQTEDSKYIAAPGSRRRVIWDLVGSALVVYDSICVPLGVFSYPETLWLTLIDLFALVFWTLNIGATMTVGYYSSGKVIMDPCQIIVNYLKTWFVIDLVTVLPDWIFLLLISGSEGGADSIRLLRMVRLARFVRLLRLMKLGKLIDLINDYLDSEYSSAAFAILQMLILLLMINHFVACLWFGTASVYLNTDGRTWVEVHKMTIEEVGWVYQYLSALHWSLTQFTPASMHIQPQNELERSFAILTLLGALVGFSYVLGSITNSIAQIRSISEKKSREFWLLRRFLRQNHVPLVLNIRIQKYIRFAYVDRQKKMSFSQVHVFSLLSKQLTAELMCSINLPVMNVHPLFCFLHANFKFSSCQLAKDGVERVQLARGDMLFRAEQLAIGVHFVARGRIQYSRYMEHKDEVKEEFVDADEDWISEHILWTASWYHVGVAQATTECEVLTVLPKDFQDAFAHVSIAVKILQAYARRFMEWVALDEDNVNDVIQGDQAGGFITALIPEDKEIGEDFARAKGRRASMTAPSGLLNTGGGLFQRFTAR